MCRVFRISISRCSHQFYNYDLLQPHQRQYEAPPVYYTVPQVPQLVRVKTVSQQVLNIDLVVGVVIILS